MSITFFRISGTFVCLLCALAASLQGQETPAPRLLVGPSATFFYGVDRTSLPVFSGSTGCGLFEKGRTITPALGGTVLRPSFFSSNFGLGLSGLLSYSSGRLSVPPVDPVRILDQEQGTLITVDEEYRLKTESWEAALDLMARVKISERMNLNAGLFAGYRLSSRFSLTEYLIAPEELRLANGHKEQPVIGGVAVQRNRFLFGPILQGTWDIPLQQRMILQPGITFRTDLLSSVNEGEWRRYDAGLSLSLLFDIRRESPPLDTVLHIPYLAASVELYGVDENDQRLPSARIEVYETYLQQHAPLVPAIFFEHDTSGLAGRYVQLTPEEAGMFSIDELSGSNILQVQHQALNIVGSRLQSHPQARITLVGSVSADEPSRLIPARVETFGDYLMDVWRVDSSRIEIQENVVLMQRSNEVTEDGKEDNRRVEMASDDLSILAPVVAAQVVRDFNPPLIKMRPRFDAEAGVEDWTLVISQGEDTLARYRKDQDENTEMSWRIVHDRVDSALSPLVATLVVHDSAGKEATAEATLPLTMVTNPRFVDQRIERNGDRERLSYTLVGFDFSSTTMGAQNNRAAEEIANGVRKGATITVIGYTDRIGETDRNRKLALERGTHFAGILKRLLQERGIEGTTLNISGEGAETEKFDNNLPEGRVLSRGVGVIVEQPVATDG